MLKFIDFRPAKSLRSYFFTCGLVQKNRRSASDQFALDIASLSFPGISLVEVNQAVKACCRLLNPYNEASKKNVHGRCCKLFSFIII